MALFSVLPPNSRPLEGPHPPLWPRVIELGSEIRNFRQNRRVQAWGRYSSIFEPLRAREFSRENGLMSVHEFPWDLPLPVAVPETRIRSFLSS